MNHSVTSHGLVIYENQVLPLAVRSHVVEGTGEILVHGPVDQGFEAIFHRSLSFVHDLADLGEILLPDLGSHDLLISFQIPIPDVPIVGGCYGLALAVGLACALGERGFDNRLALVGGLEADAVVAPVESIREKRSSARACGFEFLMLPATQLDFWSKDIHQIPVATAFEAWAYLTYDENGNPQ